MIFNHLKSFNCLVICKIVSLYPKNIRHSSKSSSTLICHHNKQKSCAGIKSSSNFNYENSVKQIIGNEKQQTYLGGPNQTKVSPKLSFKFGSNIANLTVDRHPHLSVCLPLLIDSDCSGSRFVSRRIYLRQPSLSKLWLCLSKSFTFLVSLETTAVCWQCVVM